jgi:AcrR family transcriptional regulator
MRKTPNTRRGQQRVDTILDAAADLLLDVGYADMTTNAIAAHANISIGSLYQYFSNKDTVLEALANRYLDGLSAKLEIFFEHVAERTLEAVLMDFIEGSRHFYDTYPAFEPLFFGAVNTPALENIGHDTYLHLVGRITAVMDVHLPKTTPQQRQIYAQAIVSLVKLQLPLIRTLPDEDQREQLYQQVLVMARAYIRTLTTDVPAEPH